MNFLQRSTASGVTMATDFATDAQVDPFKFGNGMNPDILKRVTRHMDNGVPCLKIATPATAADTQSQAWHRRLNDAWPNDTDGFGTTPFWIQFGFKIPPSRLIPWTSGAGGWKVAIIANLSRSNPNGAPGSSSNNLSHVIQDTRYRGFPILYTHNNANTNGVPLEEAFPGVKISDDVNLSPGWDRGPVFTNRLDRYAAYSDKPGVRTPRGYSGAPLWPIDVWITFMVRIHTRAFGGTAGNELDFMWALPGDTKWTTLLRQRGYLVGNDGRWPNGFNGIWLTTYETGRNGPGVDTYALYRELIVSTQEIAMPADAPVIVPVPDPTPKPVPVPEDNYAVVKGTRYKLLEEVIIPPPTPVDCALSPWTMNSAAPWTPEICPASGYQTRLEKWARTILTPASNGGAACGPLIETRISERACTFVPAPPPPAPPAPAGSGQVTPIFDASGSVPESWWAGLPKGTFLEGLNTKPTNLVSLLPAGFKDHGTGFGGFWNAWTGAAFDGERMWVTGGGHNDSSNNGMGEFNFRKMAWRWAYVPTVISDADMAYSKASFNKHIPPWGGFNCGYEWPNMFWKNGEPTATHSYGGIGWSQRLKQVLRAGQGHIWHMDPATRTAVKGIIAPWNSDNSSVVDEVTGKWFIFHVDSGFYSHYRVFDTIKNTLSDRKGIEQLPKPSTVKRLSSRMTPLLIGRKIVCLLDDVDYNSTITAWKMDADSEAVTDLPLINPPARVAAKAGHLFPTTGGYSPSTGLIYAMQQPSGSGKMGRFTTVNPVTGQCGEYIPTGTPPPAGPSANAPYTKFQIISRPSGDFMVLFHQFDANLRIVRLS